MSEKRHKADQAEVEARLDAILQIMISGILRSRDILHYIRKDEKLNALFGDMPQRTFEWYMPQVRDKLAEISQANRENEIALAKSRYEAIIHKALKVQDYRSVIAAQRELSKLLGLEADKNVNLNVTGDLNVKHYVSISPDDWDSEAN